MNLKQERRLAEARRVLKRLEFDGPRCNDRSGLTLLALANLRPDDPWSRAINPLLGTRAIMDFMAAHYDKRYAPNSRETIRRATLHQFVDAGFVQHNPDDPARPVNSDRTVYQLGSAALQLVRAHDEPAFSKQLTTYLRAAPGLRTQYAKARRLSQIPVTLADGTTVTLTPGGQNVLPVTLRKPMTLRKSQPDPRRAGSRRTSSAHKRA